MKKNTSIALAALFTTAALSGPAIANEQPTGKITADECVGQYIDQAFTSQEPSLKINMVYPDGYLENLVAKCEDLTKSEADFYKGMTKYRETRGKMTVEFK